jgi:N-acetylglucosaminyldiphosphoundecaprenol N-acetyl-beta-D-mannosaminyltransferase
VTATSFGVRLHDVGSWDEVGARFEEFLKDGRTHCVFTPNPEILLYAREHPDYAAVLNQADLALPDGFGVALVNFLRHGRSMRRWPGVDVAEVVLRVAAEAGERVMFLGGRDGTAHLAAERWRTEIPGLDVVVAGDGAEFGDDGTAVRPGVESEIAERIGETNPSVILVALGHPKQEGWIAKHRLDLPAARILIGVGGTLDMWGRRYPRAPRWLRSIGLEWLWRLAQQPSRLRRTLRATLLYPWRALTDRSR